MIISLEVPKVEQEVLKVFEVFMLLDNVENTSLCSSSLSLLPPGSNPRGVNGSVAILSKGLDDNDKGTETATVESGHPSPSPVRMPCTPEV